MAQISSTCWALSESELVRWIFFFFFIVSDMSAEFMWEDPKVSRIQVFSSPIAWKGEGTYFRPSFQTSEWDWSMGAARSLRRTQARHSQVQPGPLL